MATTDAGPQANYQNERERLGNPEEWGITESDADLILSFLDALDPDRYADQAPEIGTKSYSTLEAYAQNLRLTANAADGELRSLSVGELNEVFSDMGQDLSANTVQQRQSSARVFYRYHDDLGVDPEGIYIVKNEPTPVDPRDLFTRDEISEMKEAADNPRDRAIIDMAVYTGQRVRAIQTLRVGDVDVEDGRFYLNPDTFGLKGAKGMRPLLVAGASVREWLSYHPETDNESAYLFCKLPDAATGGVETPLYQSTINRAIKRAAEKAGIERADDRAHAHNLRHSFVRWAYINREMDLATIKWMMGHSPDSQTLEETYFNILDVDHARKAEEKAGTREDEEVEDLAPESCPYCDYALPPEPLACPRCGNELGPDASGSRDSLTFEEMVRERVKENNPDAEPEEIERRKEAAISGLMKQVMTDPAVMGNPSTDDLDLSEEDTID